MHKVTAIIPTLCKRERARSLERAISSLHAASVDPVDIVLVVNGPYFDPDIVAQMSARSDVRVIQIAKGSAAVAQSSGRRTVRTDFFCFLDDDDEYLPGAIDQRLTIMSTHPDAAVVITNGYRHRQGKDISAMENLAQVSVDPLRSLMRENWLASCGGLFRTAEVPPEFFDTLPIHIHWTWLAFDLAEAGKKIAVLDVPTFRIYETPNSASRSDAYLLCQVQIIQHMLAHVSRPDIACILRSRMAQVWHDISCHHLNKGAMDAAWAAHLRSLCHPSGWKFLSYTRKLLYSAFIAIKRSGN